MVSEQQSPLVTNQALLAMARAHPPAVSAIISLLTQFDSLVNLTGLNQIAQTDAPGVAAGVSGLFEAATKQVDGRRLKTTAPAFWVQLPGLLAFNTSLTLLAFNTSLTTRKPRTQTTPCCPHSPYSCSTTRLLVCSAPARPRPSAPSAQTRPARLSLPTRPSR